MPPDLVWKAMWTSALAPGYRPQPGDLPFTAIIELQSNGSGGTRYRAIAMHQSPEDNKQHADMGFIEGWSACLDQLVALVKLSDDDRGDETDWAIDSIRIDQWLWAVRLFKTRTLAANACKGGHVTVNGARAKPATTVRVGDRIEARVADRDRVVEVVEVIGKRVGAPIAATCLVDHSPPAPPREYVAPLFSRDPGMGRPTKRDRRRLDRFRNR